MCGCRGRWLVAAPFGGKRPGVTLRGGNVSFSFVLLSEESEGRLGNSLVRLLPLLLLYADTRC
jgi:hypothetical protein